MYKRFRIYVKCDYCWKEDGIFSVIVHYPKSIEKREELAKQVASVHAQTVIEYLKSMTCPAEQKSKLIESAKKVHKDEAAGN